MASVNHSELATTMTDDEETDTTTAEAEEESDAISKDELFHILQNERRRQVLRYVVNREGPFEMRSIAEQVAAWEHDTTVRELTSDERQRVYIALYQSHLSKLDDAGLIEYQQSRGIVEVTDLIDVVKPHIDGVETEAEATDEDRTPVDVLPFAPASETAGTSGLYFGGATLLSLGLMAGVWTSVIPASVLGTTGLTLAVITIFLVTGCAQLVQRQRTDAE